MTYTLTVTRPSGETLAQHTLQNGNTLRIAAQDNVYYQLAGADGMAAQGVQAGRSGNDLVVQAANGESLIIENYFLFDDSGMKNPLLGMQSNGQYVAYPIDTTGIVETTPHMLADTMSAETYSGGAEYASVPSAGGGINPLAVLAGIAGVGAIAAVAGSGGSDKSSSDQPQTPIDPINPNSSAPNTPNPSAANGEVHLSGVAQVGQTMTATIIDINGVPDSNNIKYQWYANGVAISGATGQTYTITANEIGKKLTVRAQYTDEAGNVEHPESYQSFEVPAPGDTYPGGGGSGGGTTPPPTPGPSPGPSPSPGPGPAPSPNPGPTPSPNPGPTPAPSVSTPSIARSTTAQGGIEITPQSGHDTLTVTYTDENGQEQQIIAKLDTGTNTWSIGSANPPANVSIDPASGKITLAPDAVADKTDVRAIASKGSENSKEIIQTADPDSGAPLPDAPAEPTTAQGTGSDKGSVSAMPDGAADNITVQFTDESDVAQTVTATKDPVSGQWQSSTSLPDGVTLNPSNGAIVLTPNAVKDNSEVRVQNSTGGNNSQPVIVTAGEDMDNSNDVVGRPLIKKGDVYNGIGQGGASIEIDNSHPLFLSIGKLVVKYQDENQQDQTIILNKMNGAWESQGILPAGVRIESNSGRVILSPDAVLDNSTITAHNETGTRKSPEATLVTEADSGSAPPPPQAPQAPQISNGAEQGSVVIRPTSGTDTLTITYRNESNQKQTITVNKTGNTWQAAGTLPADVELEAQSGTITLTANAVLDGSIVTAVNSANGTASMPVSHTSGNDDAANPPSNPPSGNHAPTDIELDNTTLMEGQDGAVVGKLSTIDQDANDTHTYTVSDARFEVVNGELKLKAGEKVDYATEPSVTLTVTTTDASGASYNETFTLNVQDDPNYPAPNPQPGNHAPTDIELDNTTLMEGQDGAVVGKLSTIDQDANDTHTYTVSDARFEVVNGELKLKAGEKVDYATEPNITLTVTTTDQAGASYQEDFSLQVQDDPNYPAPNTPPTGEVTITGTVQVGETLTASNTLDDADGMGTVTYRWLADDVEVGTGDTYLIQATDKDKKITVIAEYTDGAGKAESKTSDATTPVVDTAPPATTSTVSLIGPDSLNEGDTGTYTLILDQPSTQPVTVDVALELFMSNATAADVVLSTQRVEIAPGQTRATFTAQTIDDNEVDNIYVHEQFAVNIASVDGANINTANQRIMTSIVDNDTWPIISLSTDKPALVEGREATYTVHLSEAVAHDVQVSVRLLIADPADAQLSTQLVNIPAGQTSATFTVSALADNEAEGVEPFSVEIYNPQGAVIATDIHAQKINNIQKASINDVDNTPSVMLAGPSHLTVTEGENATYSLVLDHAADQDINVKVSVSGGAFSPDVIDVLIPKGEVNVQFTLTGVDNTKADPAITHYLTILSANGAHFDDSQHYIVVVDNDQPVAPTLTQGAQASSVAITSNLDISDSATAGMAEMQVRFTDESGQQHTVTARPLYVSGEPPAWELKGSPKVGVSLDAASGTITLAPEIVQDGSTVTAVNRMDSLSPASAEGSIIAAPNGSPRILPPLDLQTDENVIVSEGVNPAEYGKLVDLDGQDLFDYLTANGANILASSPSGTHHLQGSDGDDVLIAGGSVDHLAGGKGADTFVFIAHSSGDPLAIDQILDFHVGEDRINLAAATDEHIAPSSLQFDENSQQLSYRMDGDNKEYHIAIHSHDGSKLDEMDILNAINIL